MRILLFALILAVLDLGRALRGKRDPIDDRTIAGIIFFGIALAFMDLVEFSVYIWRH